MEVFPSPEHLLASVATWRTAARAELKTHLAEFGLKLEANSESALRQAELTKARTIDSRVDSALALRCSEMAREAQRLTPVAQRFGTAFTRLVDAKFRLDDAALNAFVHALHHEAGALDQLMGCIEQGPPSGELVWPRPATHAELIASLIRHLAIDPGTSLKLTLGPELARWLEEALEQAQLRLSRVAGGAGLFIANVASAFTEVQARFLSPAAFPPDIAERFAPRVRVLFRDGALHAPVSCADAEASAATNYCGEYPVFQLTLAHRAALPMRWRIGGQWHNESRALGARRSGRVILSTPSDFEPGFGDVSDEVARAWGSQLDALYWTGCHYYTQGSSDSARRKTLALVRGFEAMRAGNPRLWNHFEYVPPKNPEHERDVLQALEGACDAIDVNSTEVEPMLQRLSVTASFDASVNAAPWQPEWNVAEKPGAMLAHALALKTALRVRQVQLHGFLGDVVVSDVLASPERAVQALARARQLAANKAANASGEIKTFDDRWPVWPGADHRGLVGLLHFADAIAARYDLSDVERARVIHDFHFRDPRTGTWLLFVPHRGMHFTEGGKTGTGDTIGAGFQLFWPDTAVRPARTP